MTHWHHQPPPGELCVVEVFAKGEPANGPLRLPLPPRGSGSCPGAPFSISSSKAPLRQQMVREGGCEPGCPHCRRGCGWGWSFGQASWAAGRPLLSLPLGPEEAAKWLPRLSPCGRQGWWQSNSGAPAWCASFPAGLGSPPILPLQQSIPICDALECVAACQPRSAGAHSRVFVMYFFSPVNDLKRKP